MSKLNPENHKEIYEHYSQFVYSERIQNFGFAVMHHLFKCEVHYIDEASETIQSHLNDQGSLIIAMNHQSNCDVPTISAMVYEETIAPCKGKTIIPAKAELFDLPVIGKLIPHMQAHPTFRYNNFSRDEKGDLLREQANNMLIKLNIDHINNGGHVAIFPESTRNKSDPSEVQELKRGIGRIALGVDDPSKVLITALGCAYKSEWPIKHRPIVVVGEPFSPEGMEQGDMIEETRKRIQSVTTKAFSLISK